MNNSELSGLLRIAAERINEVEENSTGYAPLALELEEAAHKLEQARADQPRPEPVERCCCESPDTSPALRSNCCPIHNDAPRACDEVWIYNTAVEMLETFNKAQAAKGRPGIVEGSLLDGIGALIDIAEGYLDKNQPHPAVHVCECCGYPGHDLSKWRTALQDALQHSRPDVPEDWRHDVRSETGEGDCTCMMRGMCSDCPLDKKEAQQPEGDRR